MLAAIVWDSLTRIPVVLGIATGIVLLVLWLYPSQVRLLSRGTRGLLPALRVLALCALAGSILQPVLIRAKSIAEQGAVLVLIDDSRSMSVVDSARGVASRVALADALGGVLDRPKSKQAAELNARLEQADALLTDLAMRTSELDYARLAGRGVKDAQDRLDSTRTSFNALLKGIVSYAPQMPAKSVLPQRLKAVGEVRQTRFDTWVRELRIRIANAQSASTQLQNELDEQLYKTNPAVKQSADLVQRQSRFELAERALLQPQAGVVDKLPPEMPIIAARLSSPEALFSLRDSARATGSLKNEPEFPRTDLSEAITRAAGSVSQELRAIVVLSDGRQTHTTSLPVTNRSTVPILAVNVASRSPVIDLSLVRPAIPTSVFIGETVLIRGRLHISGMRRTSVTIDCSIGDRSDSKTIAITDEREIPFEFSIKVDDPGVHRVTLYLTPVPGEASVENNKIERWLKVISDRIHVGAFSGTGAWDFQYLRNALSRQAWAKLEHGILDPAGLGMPLTPEQISKLDVLVLNDVATKSLSPEQWQAVRQLIQDRGGSVLFLAGHPKATLDYLADPLVKQLLPFASVQSPAWRVWPGELPGLRIIPTAAGQKSDALRLAEDPESSRRRWMSLSPVFRLLEISELKPAATAMLMEAESKQPALVESRLGLGRVFFAGFDESWRWRYEVGERDQDRFWLQLIRYAAEEPYLATVGFYSLDVNKAIIEPNEPVRVRARLRSDAEGVGIPEAIEVAVIQYGAVERMERLVPTGPERQGKFESILRGLPVGEYELELQTPQETGQKLRVPLYVRPSLEAEMSDLTGDERFLQQLASSTGGEVLRFDQIQSLPQRINDVQSERSKVAERPLWDSPWLFGFVLACLSAEWAIRKRFGLV